MFRLNVPKEDLNKHLTSVSCLHYLPSVCIISDSSEKRFYERKKSCPEYDEKVSVDEEVKTKRKIFVCDWFWIA